VRAWWLIGCVVLGLSACGGVVRSSSGGDGGSATTTGGSMSTGNATTGGSMSTVSGSTQGGRSSGGGPPAAAGVTSVGGQASMLVQCGKRFCPAGEVCCDAVFGMCAPADGSGTNSACMQSDCALVPPAPVMLSCVRELGTVMDPSVPVNVSVPNAEISSEVVGALEGGCLEPLLRLQTNGPALSGQAMSWTISDGKRLWDVEAVVENNKIPSLQGQKVSLSYLYQFGGFGPSRRELSVVSQMSASHGVWIAEGGDVPQLGKLPLLLSRGSVNCSASEQCGTYERYSLVAFDPLSMITASLGHGQTGSFAQWVIVHGGFEEQTSAGMCPDWFVADVHVAIFGLM
jgi:hypothetical protein